jgi:hypothetical protein
MSVPAMQGLPRHSVTRKFHILHFVTTLSVVVFGVSVVVRIVFGLYPAMKAQIDRIEALRHVRACN